MKELGVEELNEQKEQICILDIRWETELSYGTIPESLWIPMDQIPERLGELPKDKLIVVYCRSGNRSEHVAKYLQEKGFDAANLTGGILAWKKIDDSIIPY